MCVSGLPILPPSCGPSRRRFRIRVTIRMSSSTSSIACKRWSPYDATFDKEASMRNRHLLKSVLPAMVLLVLLGSAMAALAQNTAGRVDFATGGVSATATGGVSRPLAKGGLVFSGDTINTDNTGRAQIRFTDGAYMSLQPQTQFRVDDYRYDGAAD